MVTRVQRANVVLSCLAALVGLVHLTYPLGREHAAAAYVGQEWLRHGRALYAGSFSQEGPGYLILSGAATMISGGSHVGLRVLSVLSVLATGWLAPLVVCDPRRRRRVPAAGLAALGASLFAHAYFDFWDAGRGGTFIALGVVAALAIVRVARTPWHMLAAGALAAGALSVRPTHWPLVLVVLVAAPWRAEGRGARALYAGLGFSLTLLSFGVLLGGRGVHDAVDLLWDGRCGYLGRERLDRGATLFTMQDAIAGYQPLSSIMAFLTACGIGDAMAKRDLRRLGRRLLIVATAFGTLASVMLLRRYYFDFESLTAAFALAFAALADDCASMFRRSRRVVALVAAEMLALCMVQAQLNEDAPGSTFSRWRMGAFHVIGRLDRDEYRRTFAVPELSFDPLESDQVAHLVATHSAPDDSVLVRGFEPQIYLRAHRAFAGRFFSTPMFYEPLCSYGIHEWREADVAAIRGGRPAVVVALRVPSEIDGVEPFLALGYQPVGETEHFVVLTRR